MQKHSATQPPRPSAWQADMLSAISNIARNIARRYVAPDVADDVAQDVVLGFVVRLEAGRLSEPPTFLYAVVKRIVRRRVTDICRKRDRREHREADYGRHVATTAHDWMRPDASVETTEFEELEMEALEEMSPGSREVFVLLREGETSYKAAGELLGLTPRAISGHFVAARRTLRTVLERKGILAARSQRGP